LFAYQSPPPPYFNLAIFKEDWEKLCDVFRHKRINRADRTRFLMNIIFLHV